MLCLALFALIAWQVAAHGPLYGWDRAVDASVLREAAAERSVRPVAQLLADLGDLPVALPVLASALGWAAWRLGRWREAVVYAVAMACAAPIVVLLKALVARPAPGTARLVAHSGYFPSGHAMTAAAAYGLAALALAPAAERVTARRALWASAVPLNVAVGAGLVWRGYHWPLDVTASWCLAGALVSTTAVVISALRHRCARR
ncbi:phosphatase PAP2 family protein [Streptomyces sp. ICBB 8177]|uniref:phosphatase PAP2 family protein n=1 Tax=Streptomyces sp. ICBB 8177 TaxID=563922 RepID=UPI001F5438A6|nr:phosphatase PAP2 family protein [Streptomyces sp. ICBB 8177]